MLRMPETQRFMESLDELEQALRANEERTKLIRQRIRSIKRQRGQGATLAEIVEREPSPLIVRMVTESAAALHTYGQRVRREEAHLLHEQGMTMDEIAEVFGVTRQRVSALVRSAREARSAEESST